MLEQLEDEEQDELSLELGIKELSMDDQEDFQNSW